MTSPVRDVLEAYLAGRVKPERLVIAVATAYYGRESGSGKRDGLGPVIEVIDRASPGIVELGTSTGGPGFDIRLAERPFPKEHEAELRQAAEVVLSGWANPAAATQPASRVPHRASRISVLGIVSWIRRLFSASA